MRVISALFLALFASPAFAQQQPPLLQFLMPGDGDVRERLDAYDTLITGACEDRAWTEPETVEASAGLAGLIAQGALPRGTTRTVSTLTASGCETEPRRHRYEVLSVPVVNIDMHYLGFVGETRVPAINLLDFTQQIAMAAGILTEKHGACSDQEAMSALAIVDTRDDGEVSLETYLEQRGPAEAPAPAVSAWRETWTLRYCPDAEADIDVYLGDHGEEGGIGIAIGLDP
ncbi:MAG: hypothetical protein ABL308_06065 [Oceanicaulis sp.]